MSEVQGVVGKVFEKRFGNKTLYSIKLDDNDTWFRCGETKPAVEEGSTIAFTFKEVKGNAMVDHGSISVVAESAPAPAPKSGGKKGNSYTSSRDQYWEDKAVSDIENAKKLSYIAAVNTAVAIVSKAVEIDAVKLGAAGKKFDNFKQAIFETADELVYNYVTSPGYVDNLLAEAGVVLDTTEVTETDSGGIDDE